MARAHRQALALARNGLLRPGADATYADGDDAAWTSVDWPSVTRTVEVDGRGVNVVDTGGDGPPLLFIHGLGALWQSWLLNIPPFMHSHRVVALDLPGFGGSEMPDGPISIPAYARTVDEVCRRLDVECPVVVGNSMGGFIGAELALDYPTRVAKLVLVAAAGLSMEEQRREPLMTFARVWAAATTRAGAYADPVIRRPRLRRAALQTVLRYPEKLSVPLTTELVRGAGKEGFLPALGALMDYSYRDMLARIEIPVLIVWGRNDMLVPVEDAGAYQRLIGANAHTVIFEDTGHVPMLERPTRFNDLLRGFVAGETAPERGIAGVSG